MPIRYVPLETVFGLELNVNVRNKDISLKLQNNLPDFFNQNTSIHNLSNRLRKETRGTVRRFWCIIFSIGYGVVLGCSFPGIPLIAAGQDGTFFMRAENWRN